MQCHRVELRTGGQILGRPVRWRWAGTINHRVVPVSTTCTTNAASYDVVEFGGFGPLFWFSNMILLENKLICLNKFCRIKGLRRGDGSAIFG
jgi:hypothetical protein